MNKHFVINKYLAREFFKITLIVTLIFFSLGFLMNLFEEINFFKNFNIGLSTPLTLALLFTPNLLYSFFPFVILISGMWFFLKIKKTDELTAINISGKSNFSIILIPSFLSVILGIFFITSVNPISSFMIKKYETIKGAYEEDLNYLAAITENGIWIREKDSTKNSIIRAAKLYGNYLEEVTIYEFDKDNDFIRRVEAETADITSLKWNLKNVIIFRNDGAFSSGNIENISYVSLYNIEKIKTLFSNLDTISFWSINKEIELL
jgi:lipopolysaccharide export system permease protein